MQRHARDRTPVVPNRNPSKPRSGCSAAAPRDRCMRRCNALRYPPSHLSGHALPLAISSSPVKPCLPPPPTASVLDMNSTPQRGNFWQASRSAPSPAVPSSDLHHISSLATAPSRVVLGSRLCGTCSKSGSGRRGVAVSRWDAERAIGGSL
jgi:hypothetical protein